MQSFGNCKKRMKKNKTNNKKTKKGETFSLKWWNRKPQNDFEYLLKITVFSFILSLLFLVLTLAFRDTVPQGGYDEDWPSDVTITYYGLPEYHFVCAGDKCAIDREGVSTNFTFYFISTGVVFALGFGNYKRT